MDKLEGSLILKRLFALDPTLSLTLKLSTIFFTIFFTIKYLEDDLQYIFKTFLKARILVTLSIALPKNLYDRF